MQWWGQRTINAQYKGLQKLGDLATPSVMRGDRLFTLDAGATFMGDAFPFNAYIQQL